MDYLGWPRRRLHSPRAERMKVTPPSAPSAQSVQTKKNGLRYPTDDVVRNVERQQEDREQRRDDQDCVLLHSILPVFDSARVESELAQRRESAHLPCGRLSTCAPTEWRHACARTTSLRRRADSGGRTAATSAGTHAGSCTLT